MSGKIYKEPNTNNIKMNPSDLTRSLDESFNFTLVFIDAGFLSKLSKHFGGGKYLKHDLIKFSKLISSKQNLFCKKIFYYTAPPFQSETPSFLEKKRKDNYDRFISALTKQSIITIREGRCQRLKINNKFGYNQKGVNNLMIIDLFHIVNDFPKIKEIILIASDSDFVPVINDLSKRGIKTILYTYYEKGRSAKLSTSNYLIKSVSKYIQLTKQDFLNSN